MDEQRAEFEAWLMRRWAGDRGGLSQNELGEYTMHPAQFAWSAYQAATQRQQERIAELQAQVQALSLDAGRLDWLTFHLSGKALRDIGVIWSEHADARAAIDTAIAAGKGEG